MGEWQSQCDDIIKGEATLDGRYMEDILQYMKRDKIDQKLQNNRNDG
jgi:hypothetical protein